MPSPHEVLGVGPDADEATVERAYRRRILETHPDHGGSVAAFQAVREAYEAALDGEGGVEVSAGDSPSPAAAEEGRSRDWEVARVEFIDYDVLADHGRSHDDPDLFEWATGADLGPAEHGEIAVEADETILAAATEQGYAWPFACRGGACANCAILVRAGEVEMPVDHILPLAMLERGIRLSCVGRPATPELRILTNVKHLPDLEDLRLPPGPFDRATADD